MVKYLFLCLFFCSSQVFAQETGIRFESGTLEAAMQKSAQEGKVLFIDCTAAFCGACRMMEKEVFSNPEVAAFFNEHFISYKLWMDKPEGKAFNETCDIPAYPTLLFMDEKGNILWKEVGGRKTQAFMELARKAYAREKSDAVRFEEGERDKTFVIGYLNKLGKQHLKEDIQAAFNVLYEEQGNKVLKDEDYWLIFKKYVGDRDCPAAMDFVENYKKYAKLHGKEVAFWKVRHLYANFLSAYSLFEKDRFGYPDDKKGVSAEKREAYFDFLKSRKLPNVEELEAQIDFICLSRQKRYDEAVALGEKCLRNADARTLCDWATLAERCLREKTAREKAAVWAERALETGTDEVCREAAVMGERLKTSENTVMDKHGKTYSLPI